MMNTGKSMSTVERAPYRAALAKHQAWLVKNEGALDAPRAAWSGQQIARLNMILRDAANGVCTVCRQDTTLDTLPRVLTTATVAVLIPCAMVDSSTERRGYVAGNVASICRGCVNYAEQASADTDTVWVWTADTLDAECVPLTWPSLPKLRPTLTPEEVKHANEVARVMAARGNV